jgi:hypothetical protein
MKKRWLLAGAAVLVLAALACLTGCPTGMEGENVDARAAFNVVRGFVGFDDEIIDELDFTLVKVQLLKAGELVGEPVYAAKNGVFEFARVENGAGYSALALVDSPLYSKGYGLAGISAGFAVSGSTPVIEIFVQPTEPRAIGGILAGGNGRIMVTPNTVDSLREDKDLGRAKVQLWRGDTLIETVKPSQRIQDTAVFDGKYRVGYAFSSVPQGYGYKITAVLDSLKFPGQAIAVWESDEFAVLYVGDAASGYKTVVFSGNAGTFDGEMTELPLYDIKGTMTRDDGAPAGSATVQVLLNGVPLAQNVQASANVSGEYAIEFAPGGGGYQLRVTSANAGDPNNLYYWLSPVFTIDEDHTVLPEGGDRPVYTVDGILSASQITVEYARYNIGLNRLELYFSLPVTVPNPGDFTVAAAASTAVTAAVNSAGTQAANRIWYLTLSRDVAKDASLALSYNAASVEFTGNAVIPLPAIDSLPVSFFEAEPFEVVSVFSRLGYAQAYIDLGIAPASFPGFTMASGSKIPVGLHLYAWNPDREAWEELTIASITNRTAAQSGYNSQKTGAVNGSFVLSRSGSGYDWATFRITYDNTAGGGYRRTTDGALLKSFDLVSLDYWHSPWN